MTNSGEELFREILFVEIFRRHVSSNIEAVRPGFLGRRRVEEGRRRAGFLGRRNGGGGPDF